MSADIDHPSTRTPQPDCTPAGERHFAGTWLADVLGFLTKELGERGTLAVLEAAGERRDVQVLRDGATWSSYDRFRAIVEAAGSVLGGSQALAGAGDIMIDDDGPGGYVESLQALGSPGAVIAAVADVGPTIAPFDFRSDQVSETEWVVSSAARDGFEPFREMCAINLGELRTFPKMFGIADVDVVEECCQLDGAPECVFRVRWSVPDEMERRAEFERLRSRVLEARVRDVHELVDGLAGADHVGTLHKIVARFAAAVIAPAAVLVADDPHLGDRAVYGVGLTTAEAQELAAEIDAGLRRDDPTVLVVDVVSARACHGYLAAAGCGVPLHQIRESLGFHARVAATALDLIAAINEAHRQARAAESMAELSTELAEIVSPGEIASKLVRATPTIVACERALAFLPEAAGGPPLLSAADGYDDETLARVRASLFGHALNDDITARGRVDECLDDAGVVDAIVEPIGPVDDPIGWLCIDGGDRSGWPAWRREARVRLRGVAAQAATAIGNAHLVDQIRHQALHDGLTGLPNRSLIQDRLGQMLARARREDVPVAVLFVDLDGFKAVNDNFGHEAGDELLRAVATRLTGALRESDVVGRLGGDEFVVLSEGAAREDDPDLIAERIISILREPFDISGARDPSGPVRVSASLGSARGVRKSPDELLRDADLALYEAKRAGKNRHVRFASDMHTAAREHALLERDLRGALEADRFTISYQPIFDLNDDRITGAEALLRWEHPIRGTVMPDVFIPILEGNGMIVEVGRWVLEQACHQSAQWHAQGFEINVSVNVSLRQLESESFVAQVTEALAASALRPRFLILEITETAIMRDPVTAVAQLNALKQLGVRLAIDDFGTGYSSLAYLQQFPVDAIKIDRSFVSAMSDSTESGTIIRALVDLGKTLGLETLAEGIEASEQRHELEAARCDSGQGYLFARPLSAAVMEQLLSRHCAGSSAPARRRRSTIGR